MWLICVRSQKHTYADVNGKDVFEASNTGEELWHIFNNNQKENNRLWDVCFGAMCYIKHAVLMHLHNPARSAADPERSLRYKRDQ